MRLPRDSSNLHVKATYRCQSLNERDIPTRAKAAEDGYSCSCGGSLTPLMCLIPDPVSRNFNDVLISQEMLANRLAIDLSTVGAIKIFQNEVIADGGDCDMLRA